MRGEAVLEHRPSARVEADFHGRQRMAAPVRLLRFILRAKEKLAIAGALRVDASIQRRVVPNRFGEIVRELP